MNCPELWCLASVDGVECKETFDTYDEFEEHFCQKHLDLALFACDAKGCTAQFGTILQIFRHLAVCKRQGKKIKLLQYSDDILESLATLDRAKLLAVQCCVKRAKRALESAEMNDDVTIDQDGQCSLDEMGFRSSSDDDQLHVPIIEPLGIRQVKNVESGSYASRSDRTVTAARQAAWRLKEQMLLEGRMKKNKPLEKPSRDTQKKQKKLPVKITDKTRISALINDDPKKVKGALGHLQTVKSDLSPDSALANMKETNRLGENMIKKQSHKIVNVIDMSGTVNSDMPFVSTKHIVSAESKPKSLLDKTQDPKQPKIFESSLPANPNHPPKIYDASHPQLSSGAIDTRPPDYSEFVRNPVINPTLREIPLSRFPIPPLQIPSVRSSNDCQNSSEINCPHTSTILASQSAMLPSSQVDVQQNRNIERHGILRTARIKNIFQSVNISCTEKSLQKKHGFQNMVGTVEETGQMDFDVLSLFSKRMQECKTLEHLKVSTTQAKELERPGEQTKSVKSNIKLEEEEPSKKFKSNTNLLDLSSDKDHERKEDVEYRETTPILLNLFSDNETTPVLFDPRIMPKSLNPDEPRNDRPNIEGEVIQEKKVGMCRDSNGYHGSSGNEKKR